MDVPRTSAQRKFRPHGRPGFGGTLGRRALAAAEGGVCGVREEQLPGAVQRAAACERTRARRFFGVGRVGGTLPFSVEGACAYLFLSVLSWCVCVCGVGAGVAMVRIETTAFKVEPGNG